MPEVRLVRFRVKFLRRLSSQLVRSLLAGSLVAAVAAAQSGGSQAAASSSSLGQKAAYAVIRSVSFVVDKDGPAIEIIANRPLVPEITRLESPERLVIDLPDAKVAVPRKRVLVRTEEVDAIRVNQYQAAPPVTRVVVDLLSPRTYTWDGAGNRLMVRLKAVPETHVAKQPPLQPPSVTSFTRGVQPAIVPVSPGASGAVVLAGNRVAVGSSVTAGADTAILRLARGGEIRVCPGTTVSVTPSQNGRDLLLGMSTGALEAHYRLDASADSILTPDFRILLPGPGQFDYALSADSRGNTCVRALEGNAASAVVSELMGDRTYQVKPNEQIVFHSGRIDKVDTAVPLECGCPPPAPAVLRAAAPSAPPLSETNLPASLRPAQPVDEAKPVTAVLASAPETSSPPPSQVRLSVAMPETAALPASQPNEVHVQVDAPFVFRASDPQPAPTREAGQLPIESGTRQAQLEAVALAPASAIEKAGSRSRSGHRGFFGKVKGFFAAIFR